MSDINVYQQSATTAIENGDLEIYRKSKQLNVDCKKAIANEIGQNYDGQRLGSNCAKTIVEEYGIERVNWVLANTLQHNDYDGRFSKSNKEWAKNFDIPLEDSRSYISETHPVLLNGFIDQVHRLVAELEKQVIPQQASDIVQGYMVKHFVLFDNDRGFAVAENPKAPDKFVTWQFTEENGKRDYYWGRYVGSEETAIRNFNDRVNQYKLDYPTLNEVSKSPQTLTVTDKTEQTDIEVKLAAIVDYIINDGTQNTSEGNWMTYFEEFPPELGGAGFIQENKDKIQELLSTREEVADIELNNDNFDVCYYLDYCPNVEQEEVDDFLEPKEIAEDTQKEKPSILAKLNENKKAVAESKDLSHNAPKHDGREL